MISTRELARLAGVNQSTVSRSLNDRPEISVETKEKIRALAKKHGYVVSKKSKKTLLTARRKAIGVLMMHDHIFDDLFIKHLTSILYGIIEQENYYAIPLFDFMGENGVQKVRDLLKLGLVEGFIIVNRVYDAVMDRYFSEIGIPYVYLIFLGRNSSEKLNVVDTDNFLGGYIAAKHLINLGHRNIVTVTSTWEEYEDRTEGFRTALHENGLTLYQENILTGDCSYDDGYRLVCENLHLFNNSTAIFAQSDLLAIGAINALKDNGIRVPQDVSVIGYDGMEIGKISRPELTSVAQPIEDLARVAVDKLLEYSGSNGKKTTQSKTFLQPSLLERQSTAVCRNTSRINLGK